MQQAPLEVAVVIDHFPDHFMIERSPWVYYAQELKVPGISISLFNGLRSAWRKFDAMILMVWLHWGNDQYFNPKKIMPVLENYATYRAAFPETIQIVVNHVDMCRRPYALPYWRMGDPILYRTPPYDRLELAPFPPHDIFPYELVWGSRCFQATDIRYAAGFCGWPSGPRGYRSQVAAEVAKVGYGRCSENPLSLREYNEAMGASKIIVCPQGWGENSMRHWDAWKSGKPVLTDKACDAVEMIPGVRLENKEHYLVYENVDAIPDLVTDWTRPGRADDLAEIAARGAEAAASYDAFGRIKSFLCKLRSTREGSIQSLSHFQSS